MYIYMYVYTCTRIYTCIHVCRHSNAIPYEVVMCLCAKLLGVHVHSHHTTLYSTSPLFQVHVVHVHVYTCMYTCMSL